jgi:hypothetical protein
MTKRHAAILVCSVTLLACAREKRVRYPPPGTGGPLPGVRADGGLPPNPMPPAPRGASQPATPVAWPTWSIPPAWPFPQGWTIPQIPGLTLPPSLPSGPAADSGTAGGGAGIAAGARYGALTSTQCFAELSRRGIAHRGVSHAPGVEIPIRLGGPLRGVEIIAAGAGRVGTNAPHDILDCRLALALDDFAAVVSARGIVRVNHMSMYRKGATVAGKGTPSQHAVGLAIDIGSLRSASGTLYTVQRDWGTARGSPPCPGPGLESPAAAMLRDVVCSSIRNDVFNTYITPNHNAAHDNHFHFDLVLGEPGIYAELTHR